EAGLRTDTVHNPFPEEANRRLTARIASLHLAPTATSRDNLLREGVDPSSITVTGNTVIDALLAVAARPLTNPHPVIESMRDTTGPVLLVTAHRRESWGEPMVTIGRAVARLVQAIPELTVVWPLHPNPLVRESVLPEVQGLDRVLTIEPLDYHTFVHAMQLATVVLTDSGGVQEEAPSLGKPVLVMRDNTERPEAVIAGTAALVGTKEDLIVGEVTRLLTVPQDYERMAQAVNPYGDGRAAERAVAAIAQLVGIGSRMPEFEPTS
ncbi:MAG: non-hydrolyzing UDP-N-acetylglucosamine 2-epimerase, partial [Propioniciclava sp.]